LRRTSRGVPVSHGPVAPQFAPCFGVGGAGSCGTGAGVRFRSASSAARSASRARAAEAKSAAVAPTVRLTTSRAVCSRSEARARAACSSASAVSTRPAPISLTAAVALRRLRRDRSVSRSPTSRPTAAEAASGPQHLRALRLSLRAIVFRGRTRTVTTTNSYGMPGTKPFRSSTSTVSPPATTARSGPPTSPSSIPANWPARFRSTAQCRTSTSGRQR
jgi:hypothetical protein